MGGGRRSGPGGSIREGEAPEAAALREARKETGLTDSRSRASSG
ncbi:NUDIX domain-containing protein [Streptomyces clavifer]